MATLTVRKLDDTVYARLGAQAKRNNRSLEAEARAILEKQAFDVGDWLRQVRANRERFHADHGPAPDAVSLIRAVRDEE